MSKMLLASRPPLSILQRRQFTLYTNNKEVTKMKFEQNSAKAPESPKEIDWDVNVPIFKLTHEESVGLFRNILREQKCFRLSNTSRY